MNRADFSNLGGFPLQTDTLDFLQASYTQALAAIANLCGNKTILYGVTVAGGNVSPGWISYNGELIAFVGGPLAADVVITDTANITPETFEDGTTHDVYFTKTATCGASGDFPFSDLVPLLSLQNIWLPNDIKERYVDNAYIAANFDVNGFGINKELGWRIFSSVVPDAAGKVFVNLDPTDSSFDTIGETGGGKTHAIGQANLPAVGINVGIPVGETSQGETGSGKITMGGEASEPVAGPNLETDPLGAGVALNTEDPYFVILKLIKL